MGKIPNVCDFIAKPSQIGEVFRLIGGKQVYEISNNLSLIAVVPV